MATKTFSTSSSWSYELENRDSWSYELELESGMYFFMIDVSTGLNNNEVRLYGVSAAVVRG